MKSVCLLSGGKDSFLSAVYAMEQGIDVVRAITVLPEEDSMMFHVPNIRFAEQVASILDLSVEFVGEDKFAESLADASKHGIECVISGAIASEYQKTRIERLCTELGLVSFTPLWRKTQRAILDEIINSEVHAIIVSVSAEGLGREMLGRKLDMALIEELENISASREINIAGEGGEYETFVTGYDGKKELVITESEISWSGSSGALIIRKIEY